jgi:hypothetical protein
MNNESIHETTYTTSAGPRRDLVKPGLWLLCIVALLIVLGVTASTILQRNRTGVLDITASDPSAELQLLQAGNTPQVFGKGSGSVRVNPGTYTILAKASDKQALQVVSVEKQQHTSANLDLGDGFKSEKLSAYAASNVGFVNNALYFINIASHVPNKLLLSEQAARPIATTSYPAQQAYWLTNGDFYVNKSGNWNYFNGTTLQKMQNTPADSSLISFNQNGGYAYIDSDKNVQLAASPTTAPTKVATLSSDGHNLSLSSNDSLLVYSTAPSSKDRQAKIISNGQTKTIDNSDLENVQFASWSPNSQKISFSTLNGLYIYDLAKNSTTTITSITPTNSRAIAWLDDNTLVFGQDQSLWKYSLGERQSTWISNFADKLYEDSPFSIASGGGAIYYSTHSEATTNTGSIFRIVLDKNKLGTSQPTTISNTAFTYKGFELLGNQGLTSDQLANVKYAVNAYVKAKQANAKSATITQKDIGAATKDINSSATLEFTISFDGTKLPAKLVYTGLSTIRLYIFNTQGAQVFDSGDISS